MVLFAFPLSVRAQTVAVDTALCRYLTAHEPAAGVEYKPSEDVHGKPVVEADLNPSAIAVPETLSFNLSVDIVKYLNLQGAPQGTQLWPSMGVLTLDKNRLYFNGKPLESEQETALRTLCLDPQ